MWRCPWVVVVPGAQRFGLVVTKVVVAALRTRGHNAGSASGKHAASAGGTRGALIGLRLTVRYEKRTIVVDRCAQTRGANEVRQAGARHAGPGRSESEAGPHRQSCRSPARSTGSASKSKEQGVSMLAGGEGRAGTQPMSALCEHVAHRGQLVCAHGEATVGELPGDSISRVGREGSCENPFAHRRSAGGPRQWRKSPTQSTSPILQTTCKREWRTRTWHANHVYLIPACWSPLGINRLSVSLPP